jgi:antitoxin HicB
MNNSEKTLLEYLRLPYTIVLQRDSEDDFIARIQELDGCIADGQDEMEAIAHLEFAKRSWLQAALEAGRQIPLPESTEELPSGKFLTRVSRSMHQELSETARAEGVSLNALVNIALAEFLSARRLKRSVELFKDAVVNTICGSGYGAAWTPSQVSFSYSPHPNSLPMQIPEERTFFRELTADERLLGSLDPQLVTQRGEVREMRGIRIGR